MTLRRERPPNLRHIDRRLHLPPKIGKPHLTHKEPGSLLLHHPVAKTQKGPVPRIPKQLRPRLLPGKRPAPKVTSHLTLAPHLRTSGKILPPVQTQQKPFSLNHHIPDQSTKTALFTNSAGPCSRTKSAPCRPTAPVPVREKRRPSVGEQRRLPVGEPCLRPVREERRLPS